MKALEIGIVLLSLFFIVAFVFVSGLFMYTVYINHQTPDTTVCNGGERLDAFCKAKDCKDIYYHWVKVNKTNNCSLDTMDSSDLTYLKGITGYNGSVYVYV